MMQYQRFASQTKSFASRPKRILVTGASGLLGINLALEASQEHSVYGLVNSHGLKTTAFQVVEGDLLVSGTAERLLDEIQPEWVIHCAALANLDACEADPALAYQLNTEAPRKLARLVARSGARLIHISTDAVFDGLRGNYRESDQPNPISTYARTKRDAELAVLEENPLAVVARVNLFGFSPSGKRSLSEFFLYNLQAGKQVMGFTDVIFCPLLANDLGAILLQMLEGGLSGLYHVVSSECTTKYDFGVRIARAFGFDERLVNPTTVMMSSLQAARSPNLSLCSDKLAADLGKPLPDISTGLKKFHQLYQDGYPGLIRNIAN